MFVHDVPGQPQEVTFPTPSLRVQRLLGGSVAALLTANAFAVASLLGDDGSAADRLRRPAALGDAIVPTSDDPPTVALITTGDGRTFMADPSTVEGRRAIEQARRDGSTVRNLAVPPRTASSKPGTSLPLPGSVGGTAIDLPGLIGSILPTTPTLPGTGGDDGDDGLLEIDPGLVQGLLKDPVGTATSIVQTTPTTVTSIVASTPSTVTSIVESTPTTLTSIVASTPTTLGVLGQVPTTAVQSVESVTPTTAPAPTTGDPVCTLLVACR